MKTYLVGLLALAGLAVTASGCFDNSGTCQGDRCVCPIDDDCDHACQSGSAQCHIQGTPGYDVDVSCSNNLQCHVECRESSSCRVDCGGSTECHVSCPATGCTVTNCIGAACVVSCGLNSAASRSGSTASCP